MALKQSEIAMKNKLFLSITEKDRPEITNLVPYGSERILDVGCGWGDVGAALKRREECEVMGIELDPERAKIASTKVDQVIMKDIETETLEFGRGYFDCILFADVLEHLKAPLAVLCEYASYLKDDGCLIISIPNIRHVSVLFNLVVLGKWEYQPFGIMDYGHLRFFTLKSFRCLLDKAELSTVKMDRIFSLKGSKLINSVTFGIFSNLLTAQYVFLLKKKMNRVDPVKE